MFYWGDNCRDYYDEVDGKYFSAFGTHIPLYGEVAEILEIEDGEIYLHGVEKLDREVDKRIKENRPFVVPDFYWNMMW